MHVAEGLIGSWPPRRNAGLDAGGKQAGLSHLGCPERGEQSDQEGVVPSRPFELSLHGAF
jgi:hypothetical protein